MPPGAPIQTAQVLTDRYGPSYRWLVTITGMVGVVSMVLAMTTVNVAVPDVMGAFGIGQDKAQWMSSAYAAAMTAGMLMNAAGLVPSIIAASRMPTSATAIPMPVAAFMPS